MRHVSRAARAGRRREFRRLLLPLLGAILVAGFSAGCGNRYTSSALPPIGPDQSTPGTAATTEPPADAPTPDPMPAITPSEEPTPTAAAPSSGHGEEPPLPPAPPVQAQPLPPGVDAPVLTRLHTDQPVVFVTIDDGWTRDPRAARLIKDLHLPVTAFLIDAAVREEPTYFRGLQDGGATVEDHTLTHPDLRRLSLAGQERELCGAADSFASRFGTRPTLMRPPYGSYNLATQRAAAACGLKAVVTWDVEVKYGRITFADARSHLAPGDIVLLHFRPELHSDLQVLLAQIRADKLAVGRLEDYL